MATRFSNESTGGDIGEFGGSQAQTRGSRRKRRNRPMRGIFIAATVASLIAPMSGCMFIGNAQRALTRHEGLDEFMVDYRNRAWAARAWLCRKNQFASHCYPADLEAGFRQGYEDVAAGGSGCLPAVCPRSYWGWQYQSADGQARMNAWFEGYPLGVQAAEQDGVGHWGNVAAAFPLQKPAPISYAAPAAVAEGAGETNAQPGVLAPTVPVPVPVPEIAEPIAPMIEPKSGMVLPLDAKPPVEVVLPPATQEL